MCVRRTRELTSMTDGIFGLGTMQGENQDKGVAFNSESLFVLFSCCFHVRVGSRDRIRAVNVLPDLESG